MKSLFQALRGCGNESRRGRKEEIEGLCFPRGLIDQKSNSTFCHWRENIDRRNLSMIVRSPLHLQSRVQMKCQGVELMLLSHGYWICDEALRFCHVIAWRGSVKRACPLDLDLKFLNGLRVMMSPHFAFNLNHNNSRDERPGYITSYSRIDVQLQPAMCPSSKVSINYRD